MKHQPFDQKAEALARSCVMQKIAANSWIESRYWMAKGNLALAVHMQKVAEHDYYISRFWREQADNLK